MKRKFAILLATTLALNSIPAPVFASDDFDIPVAAVQEDAELAGFADDFAGVAEAVEPEVVEEATEAGTEEVEEVDGLAEDAPSNTENTGNSSSIEKTSSEDTVIPNTYYISVADATEISKNIPDQTWVENVKPDLSKVDALATITVTGFNMYGEAVKDIVLTRDVDYTVESSTADVTNNAEVIFTGIGNYANTTIQVKENGKITFAIVDPEAKHTYSVSVDASKIVYDGTALTEAKVKAASTVLMDGNTKLTDNDYSVTLPENVGSDAGTTCEAVYKVADKEIHKETVTIAKKNLADVKWALSSDSSLAPGKTTEYTYDSKAKEPTAAALGALTADKSTLAALATTDYKVTGYENNINATKTDSKAVAVIEANSDCKNYTGSGKVEFTIKKYTGSVVATIATLGSAVYTGSEIAPETFGTKLRVYFNQGGAGTIEIPEDDYKLEYTEKVAVGGLYGVKIVGNSDKGNIEITGGGQQVANVYEIKPANMSSLTIAQIKDIPAGTTQNALTQNIGTYFSFKLGENTVDPVAQKFAITYSTTNNDAGDEQTLTFKAPATGSSFTGETTKSFTYTVAPFATAYKAKEAYKPTYTGKELRPTATDLLPLTLKDSSETGVATNLTANDFTITDVKDAVNAGTAQVMIEGRGKYQGQKSTIEFTINPASVDKLGTLSVTGIADGSYFAGQELKGVTVSILDTDGKTVKGTLSAADCKVIVKTVDSLSLKAVTVEGIGNYTGKKDVELDGSVKSTAVSIANATITSAVPAGLKDYDKEKIKKYVTVTIDGSVLSSDMYDLSYDGTSKPDAAKVKVGDTLKLKVIANQPLTDLQKFTATVVARDIAEIAGEKSKNIVLATNTDVTALPTIYNGKEQKPSVTINVDANTNALKEKTDYTISYSNNIDAGEATVTITGVGNFTGTASKTFEIRPVTIATNSDITWTTPDVSKRQFAVGPTKDLSSELVLTVKNNKDLSFVKDKDYTIKLVSPLNIKKEGTTLPTVRYEVTINKDSKNYTANEGFKVPVSYQLAAKTVNDAEITIGKNAYEYNDTLDAAKLEETIVVDGEKLVRGTDYKLGFEKIDKDGKVVTNWSGNKIDDVEATYKVVVTFKGTFYVGTAKKTLAVGASAKFNINDVKIVLPTTANLIYSGTAKEVKANYIGALNITNADSQKYYKLTIYDEDGKVVNSAINVGTYKAVVEATANYGGAKGETVEFKITPKQLTKGEFETEAAKLALYGYGINEKVEYKGESTDKPFIRRATQTDLVGLNDSDFEVVEWDKVWDLSQSEDKGKAKVALKAGANYTYEGTYDKLTFTWTKGSLNKEEGSKFFKIDNVVYNGQAQHPQPVAVEGSDIPVEWITKVEYKGDVTNAYSNNASAIITVKVPDDAKKFKAGPATLSAIPFVIDPYSVEDATITAIKKQTYTGKAIKPVLDVTDETGAQLEAGSDFKVTYTNNVKVGTASVTIKGIRNYTGEQTVEFKIVKAANKITKVTPVKKALKAAALKKKAQKFTLKATAKTKGKITFKKTSGNKKITVSKAGKVTVKKGLKKGTYTIKVKATVAATATTKAASATKAIKITVK